MSIRDVVLRLTLQNNLTASATSASRAITSLADAGVAARRQLLGLADGVTAAGATLRGPARTSMRDIGDQLIQLSTSMQAIPSARIRDLGQSIQQLAPQMGVATPAFQRISLRILSMADALTKLESRGKTVGNATRQQFLKIADSIKSISIAPEELQLRNVEAQIRQIGNSTQVLSSSQIAGLGQRMQQLAPQMGAASPAIQRMSQQLLGLASSMKTAEHAAKTMDAAMQGSVMAKTPRVAKMLAVTQSAAQGMLLSSSIARPNIMGLAMSLVFLQFSVVKVALAFTALGLAIFGAVGLIKGMLQGGAAAEQFATRLEYLTKSLRDARAMFIYSRNAAMKWGIPKEELQDAIETLGRAKILGTNTMDLIANIRAGTGDSMKSIATAFESVVEGNATALKKYGIPDASKFQDLAAVMEALAQRYKGAADKMGATTVSLGERIKATFGTAIERLGESFNLGIKPLIELLYLFVEAILNTVTGFVQTESYAKSFADRLKDIQAAARKAAPYIQFLGRIIGTLLVGALQLFLRLIKPTIDALGSFARTLKDVWNNLMDFLQKVKQWVSELIPWWNKVTEGINWAAAILAAILLAIATVKTWWPILKGLIGRGIIAAIPLLLWFAFEKPIREMLVDSLGEDLGNRVADTLKDLIVAGSLGYFLLGPKGLIIAIALTVLFKINKWVLPDISELIFRIKGSFKELEKDPIAFYLRMWLAGAQQLFKAHLVDPAKAAWEAIKFIWTGLGKTFEGLAGRGGPLETLWLNIQTFWTNIKNAWVGIEKATKDAWGEADSGTGIAGFLKGLWDTITETARRIFGDEDDSIRGFIRNCWEGIKNKAAEIWGDPDAGTGISGSLKSIWDTITSIARRIFSDDDDSIRGYIRNCWKGIKDKAEEIWGDPDAGTGITGALKGAWDAVTKVAQTVFGDGPGTIRGKISECWENIQSATATLWGNADAGTGIAGALKSTWTTLTGIAQTVFGEGPGTIRGQIADCWNGIKSSTESIWNSIAEVIKGSINRVIDAMNGFFSALSAIRIEIPEVDIPLVGIVGGGSIGMPNIPHIPRLATGALVTSPTLAMIGEGGEDEYVIPKSKMGGTQIINIYAQGSQFLSRRGMNEFADSVFEAAARKLTGPRRLSLQTIS